MKSILAAVSIALLIAAPTACAHDHGTTKVAASHGRGDMTEGEVRKVDKDQGKITVKHGEIKSLDMPAMTMVFRVKDKALLDNVHAGEKIKFFAEKIDGNFTITQIEVAPHKH
jgi:Cu/Ag efflux protein CusF